MGGQSPPKDHVAPAKCTPLNAGLRNKKGGSKERETKHAGAKSARSKRFYIDSVEEGYERDSSEDSTSYACKMRPRLLTRDIKWSRN